MANDKKQTITDGSYTGEIAGGQWRENLFIGKNLAAYHKAEAAEPGGEESQKAAAAYHRAVAQGEVYISLKVILEGGHVVYCDLYPADANKGSDEDKETYGERAIKTLRAIGITKQSWGDPDLLKGTKVTVNLKTNASGYQRGYLEVYRPPTDKSKVAALLTKLGVEAEFPSDAEPQV